MLNYNVFSQIVGDNFFYCAIDTLIIFRILFWFLFEITTRIAKHLKLKTKYQ